VRKWIEPVPLADVARAATSEIEQYARVLLNIQPGIVVSGQAAADVVHLLAEIIENATMFSPADTSVYVSGQEVSSGGLLLEVRDSGIGVSPARLDEMNWRLDNPPLVDVSVSRHMGLFAVSRLAARHGVRVRLRAATPQGLSALVWLPGNLTGRGSARYIDQRSRQLAQESFTPLLGTGGRRRAGRRGLDTRGPGAGQLDTAAEQPDAAQEAAMAGAAGTSSWFRAKRPSGRDGRDTGYARDTRYGSAAPDTGDARDTSYGSAPRDTGHARDTSYGSAPRDTGHARDTGYASTARHAAADGGWADGGWADTGWRVAETFSPPVPGDQTPAGLPTRVPGANLFHRPPAGGPAADRRAPGQRVGDAGTEPLMPPRRAPLPRRSPDLARTRLSGFQLGSREAEAGTPSAGEGASR